SQQREPRRQALAPSRFRETQVGPRSPVDSQGRLALSSSVMRQGVQKSIRRGVVPLTRLAQERASGRKKYEEVQGRVFEQAMQQPSARHLGPQNRIQRGGIKL